MVRNFRGQVRIADVQAEFDALIAKINADIEEYNKVINDNENIDFTHGSPSLSGSGYCLTVGGLKKLLAAYNGTMMGAKPFRNSAGDTLVTAGVLVQSTGCSSTAGAIVDGLGKHLYFNPTSKEFTISNDASSPSINGYAVQPSIPKQDSNDGTYYLFDDYFSNPTQSYMILGESIADGYSVNLSRFGSSRAEECNSMRVHVNVSAGTEHRYLQEVENKNTTCQLHIYIPDVRTMSGYTDENMEVDIRTSGNNGYVLNVPITNIQNIENYTTVAGTCTISQYGNERGRLLIFSLQSASEITTEVKYIDFDVSISVPSGSNVGDAMTEPVSITIFNFDISGLYVYGSISPSGVCDMNPNRTYPYLKTIHNTELYNLRTNKIITESRNLTNGSKKNCSKIANDTWTADDNKNESIFVSYNARHSNDGQPNPPVYLNIEGLRSNFNIGTRFTHGSSTSACYRFPKFFFLPKGCRNPFSTTDINTNRIRYNKYKCNITQKK